MKKSLLLEVLIWLAAVAPLVYLGISWNQLPEMVPTHFNVSGEADGFSTKTGLLGILAFLTLPLNLVIAFVPRLDPKRNFDQFPGAFQRLRLVLSLTFATIGALIVYSALHTGFNPAQVLTVVLGALFAGLGNYLGTVKPNYFVGIRTPWTLENETVWRKTHRLGARWFFAMGLIIMVGGFVVPARFLFWLLLVLPLVVCVGIVYYSWMVYQQERKAA